MNNGSSLFAEATQYGGAVILSFTMYYEYLIRRLLPFSVGFLSAVFVTSLFQTAGAITQIPDVPAVEGLYYNGGKSCRSKFPGHGTGYGIGSDTVRGGGGSGGQAATLETPLTIFHKPTPGYTAEARENGTEGTVRLRVTFESNGEIGAVDPLNDLGNGLTERAIEAARGISFQPAIRDGAPVSSTKVVEYTFAIY